MGGREKRAQVAGPAAPRAWHVEAHLACGLLNRARSPASGAGLRRADGACSMARPASVQPCDRELLHCAAHRIPEINLNLVFQVAAAFGLRLHCGATAPAAEKLAEEIAEAGSAA